MLQPSMFAGVAGKAAVIKLRRLRQMGVDGGWDGVTKATICLGRSCSVARWRRLMKPDFFTPTNVIEPLNSVLRERKRHAHFERHLREFITERRGSIPIRRAMRASIVFGSTIR
jgi:hypothetical protein